MTYLAAAALITASSLSRCTAILRSPAQQKGSAGHCRVERTELFAEGMGSRNDFSGGDPRCTSAKEFPSSNPEGAA